MTRMAGDAMKNVSIGSMSMIGSDPDTVEFEDGEKIHKDDVREYVKNNYKKNEDNSYGSMDFEL